MNLPLVRARQRGVEGDSASRKRRSGLMALVVIAGVVMAPVAGALTASPASAATPTASPVGSLAEAGSNGLTQLSVSPQNVGDVLVVTAVGNNTTLTVNTVTGGGVTTWKKALQYDGVNEPRDMELWYGSVTSTGSSTITFTWNGSISGLLTEYDAQEFTTGQGAATVWNLDKTGHQENASSTTVSYPSLAPAAAGELYFGFVDIPNSPSAGSTSGFTYVTAAAANQVAYNANVGSGAVQPTSAQSPAGVSSSVAALLSVGGSSSSGISAVGATAHNFGAAITSLAVTPLQVGDVLVVMDEQDDNAITTTSLSGGGVTTWKRAIQYVGTGEPQEYELWYGQITSTGSSTIAFTLSGSNSGHNAEYEAQEFTTGQGAATVWTLDKTGHQENASSTTLTYPSLTPAAAGELYFGFIDMPDVPSAGSTPGFTYFTTPDANQLAYNPASGAGVLQPTSTQSPAAASSSIAMLLSASGISSPTPPTVTGVSPSSGSTAGGMSVIITGTNLTGATAVKFGSTSATTFTVNGATQITATAPAESAATVDVTVTTPQGTSVVNAPADHYTFATPTPPTVTGVSPSSGSTAGGTSVVITGTNLTGATNVMFGSTAGVISINSATSITVTSPAEPAWQTDITVITPSGTSATGSADTFTFSAAAPVATGTPHLMEIMMENEAPQDVIGNSQAPNINRLSRDYGTATDSFAIGHPSLPNYIEMISGSNYGVTDDGTPQSEGISSSATTIVNQLQSAGDTWRAYFGSMPSDGYTGGDTGGQDTFGGELYLQHHNPFIYFPAVTGLSDFTTNTVPLTSNAGVTSDLNAAGAPDFVWVSPNALDDMHDGPTLADGSTVPTVGDTWLAGFIGAIQSTSWYGAGGQIVVQWDEGLDSDTSGLGTAGEGGGGAIPTLVISSALQASPQLDSTPVNTAGVLRSVENVYGLPFLADAANTGNGNIDSLMTATPLPPTVSGVSPATGTTAGGTSVVITGANFTGASAVKFGTVVATSFTVNSATQITATAPAESASTVDVTVTNPQGTSPVNAPADHFTFATPAPPTVTGVSPATGTTAGGTSVIITGTNFTGASAVKFGTVAATSFTVNSATQITATAPAESASTVDVTVTTSLGTSPVNAPADHFTFATPVGITAVGSFTSNAGVGLTALTVSPQTVGDVLVVFAQVGSTTPTVSSVSGGGVATWTKGVQFAGSEAADEEIWFGKVTTTGTAVITFNWSSSIASHTAEYGVQEYSAGLGSSSVWTLDKSGTLNNASSTSVGFPSLAPSASGELYFGYSVLPNAPSTGSTAGFTYPITADGNIVASDPTVSGTVAPTAAQSPAGISSSIGVLLSVSGGTPPPTPTVTGLSPTSGSTAGGTSVIITGTNLTGATGVKFGTVAATTFTVNSATQITAIAPAGTGTVDVTVTTPGGTSAVNAPADQFTYTQPPPPGVTGVSPTSGSTAGGTSVIITGTNLTGASAVTFGTVAATTFTVNSATQITAIAPAGTGTVDVSVTTARGTSPVNAPADQFTYTAPSPPTVTGVSPATGSTSGGTSVIITGTNFAGATEVKFGTVAATTFTVNSATQITATAPAGTGTGTVDVTVTTPAGTSAVNAPADHFTYTAPSPPTVTGVSPATGSTAGGTSVIITGTNLTGATGVKFGTVAATTFTVNSATQITATAPAGTGTVDVTVTTPAGTSAVNAPADHFTYTAPSPPTVTGVSPATGSTAGGTSVIITGTNLTGATGVKFGTVAATTFTVNSATQITATAPAGTGTVDVTVTTPAGTSAVNAPADHFTYSAPAGITPVGSLTSKDGSALGTLAVSPQTVGDVLVVFALAGSTTTPKVSSISGGGVTTWTKGVQLAGSAGDEEELWFGTVTTTGASTITFTWSSSITGHTMEYGAQEFTAGLGSNTIWTLDKSGTLNNASSTTVGFPSLTPSASGELYDGFADLPNSPSAGSTSGFTYGVTADGNLSIYSPNVSSTVAPTATQSPAGISSTIGVLLSASAATPLPPTVSGVSPATGTTAGGTSVVITGANFTGASAVKFGTVVATSFTVNSATQITATAPAESASTVDVTVTNPQGTSPVNAPADHFTFATPAPPTVTGVSPATGTTAGGTSVIITGTNFTGASAVKFGTVAATSFTVNSATQITATAPAESASTVDVTVTTSLGTSPVNAPADHFTFATPVGITAVGSFTSNAGVGLTALTVSPQTVGDVLVVFAQVGSTTPTVSSVSGGGVATWTKGVQFAGSEAADEEIWFGKVTTTGTAVITFNWSSSIASHTAEYGVQEYSAGLGSSSVWTLDKSGTLNNASSTSVGFPSLAPSASGELYFGYSVLPNAPSTGSTAGFTYPITADGNIVASDPTVSGTVAPTAAQSPAGISSSIGVLLSVS